MNKMEKELNEKINDNNVIETEKNNTKQNETTIESNPAKKETVNYSEEIVEKKSNKALIIIFLVFSILILVILSTIFALLNVNNTNIFNGVKIQGINISNYSKENAYKILEQKIIQNGIEDVTLKYEDNIYNINLEQIGLQYNIEKTLEDAYKWGRNKNIIVNNFEILYANFFEKNFELNITYNEEKLNDEIKTIESTMDGAIVQPDYYIENNVLIITKGTKGLKVNQEEVKKILMKNIKDNSNEIIKIKAEISEPNIIDIDKIHDDVCISPQNATYINNPLEIFPEVNGIDFDIGNAKALLKTDQKEYRINLIITAPDITIVDLGIDFTPDLLGKFSTKFDSKNTNRSTNLRLAAEKINGTIIMPGEIFSYNKVVGERTVAKGYKSAGIFSGGKVINGIGGGICQISSTLYNAAIYANLEIVSRKNHAFLTGYVDPGRDATVVYGAIDFQFKNTRKYPIKIVASAINGVSKMEIYGIKEDVEYEIDIVSEVLGYKGFTIKYEDTDTLQPGQTKVLQNGIRGCKSVTYKILKLNGREISKEKISADNYNSCTKIVARGIEVVQEITQTEEVPEKAQAEVVQEKTQTEVVEPIQKTNIIENKVESIITENPLSQSTDNAA